MRTDNEWYMRIYHTMFMRTSLILLFTNVISSQISRWFDPLVDYQIAQQRESCNDYSSYMFEQIINGHQFVDRGNDAKGRLKEVCFFHHNFSLLF
jgi:hypothetical protein